MTILYPVVFHSLQLSPLDFTQDWIHMQVHILKRKLSESSSNPNWGDTNHSSKMKMPNLSFRVKLWNIVQYVFLNGGNGDVYFIIPFDSNYYHAYRGLLGFVPGRRIGTPDSRLPVRCHWICASVLVLTSDAASRTWEVVRLSTTRWVDFGIVLQARPYRMLESKL